MGTKANPGKYDAYARAEPDEPILVLVARDPAAPDAIEDWADLRGKMVRHGARPDTDWDMIFEARNVAQEMREWYRVHRPSLGASASEVEPPRRQDAKVRTCRACGCTDDHACAGGCWWAGDDICSACAEWPAEPWVTSEDIEDRGCIFQEGEVNAIAVVDVDRENPDDYVHATAKRIAACVNAMAGIADPEAFMRDVAQLSQNVIAIDKRVAAAREEIAQGALPISGRFTLHPQQAEPDNSGIDDYIARPPRNFDREE